MNSEREAVVATRTSLKTLASLAKYFESEGMKPRTKSELLNQSLTLLYEVLVRSKKAPVYISTQTALETLQSMGLEGFNPQGRGLISLAEKLQAEDNIDVPLHEQSVRTRALRMLDAIDENTQKPTQGGLEGLVNSKKGDRNE